VILAPRILVPPVTATMPKVTCGSGYP
jgi:hypothetical protein